MAADPIFINVVIGFAIGALGGAFSAFLGWIKSNEAFEAKKFVLGVVTGVIAGIVIVQGSVGLIQGATDATTLLGIYIAIVLGIIGVDTLRTAVSGAVASRAENRVTKAKQE